MTNTEGLDNMNFDVLTEIGNIGAGNAVTALSQMINAKVDMYVPQEKMLTKYMRCLLKMELQLQGIMQGLIMI